MMTRRCSWLGPATLFVSWALHDVEEAIMFPAACDELADRTGIERLRMTPPQSWAAVGAMGILIITACADGARRGGESRLYRATVAGLRAHVGTHLLTSLVQRGYTPGVLTALPVMLPGAQLARRKLRSTGAPLYARDYARGAAILLPAAFLSHAIARAIRPQS